MAGGPDMTGFKAACIQLNVGRDLEPNIHTARDLIFEAAAQGADFIATPECTGMIEPDSDAMIAKTPFEGDHPGLPVFADAARQTGAWLLIGSLAIKRPADLPGGRIANRSYLFDPAGNVATTYDKIHMFDVEVGDGQTYKESATYEPGGKAVVAETPWGRFGLSICYDVRFAYLYRDLAKAGADVLCVPAAFTKVTGDAHWHVLQRARAIETGSFIIAPAQCGTHAEDRQTFGHSLIVDPWGTVIADGGENVGVITADIDLAKVGEARRKIPALTHDRTYDVTSTEGAEPAAPRRQAHG